MSSHRELTLARELAAERADNLRLREQVAKLEKWLAQLATGHRARRYIDDPVFEAINET